MLDVELKYDISKGLKYVAALFFSYELVVVAL
jgi:hypothetical protein